MKKIILVLALLVLTAACMNTLIISDNAIIKLKIYGGFIAPAYAVQEMTVNKTTVTYRISSAEGNLTKEYVKPINQSTYSNLIQLFRDVNFLRLNDSYTSATPVFDVGTTEISLMQDDVNKTVKIEPLAKNLPAGLLNISEALGQLAEYVQTEEPAIAQLKFQPMQCEQTPWQKWYAEGNIQFIMAPTEKQLVAAYYSNKYGIEIMDFERVEPGLAVCEACSVCPQDYYINVKVKSSDADEMIAEEWVKI